MKRIVIILIVILFLWFIANGLPSLTYVTMSTWSSGEVTGMVDHYVAVDSVRFFNVMCNKLIFHYGF